MAAGLYAANMPEEVGGAGPRYAELAALRDANWGGRTTRCTGPASRGPRTSCSPARPEQREKYLMPCIRGETWDCLAMTEPGAGSDLRGMKATARPDGGDWVLNGTKHFISHADIAGLRHRLHGDRRGGDPARAEEAHHRLLRRQGHARLHRPRRLPQRLAPRLHQRGAGIRRLPGARATRCWARSTRGSRSPIPGSAPRGCRSPRPASAAPSARSAMPSTMPPSGASSASRSASSRACRSSLPTWRRNCARRNC